MKTIEKHIKNSIEKRKIFPKDDLWYPIEQQIDYSKKNEKKPKFRTIYWLSTAASLVLLIAFGVYNYTTNKNIPNIPIAEKNNNPIHSNITPVDKTKGTKINMIENKKNSPNHIAETTSKLLQKKTTHTDYNTIYKKPKDIYSTLLDDKSVVEIAQKEQPYQAIPHEIEKTVEMAQNNRIPQKSVTSSQKKKYTSADALLFSVENEKEIIYTKKTFTEQVITYVEKKIK